MTQFIAAQQWARRVARELLGDRRPTEGSLARNVTILGGGTALAQGLNVLLGPILTRLYPPDSLGQFALFASFLNVAMVAVSLRYELGIVAARTQQKAAELAFAALLFALPVSLIGAWVLFLLIRFSILGFNNLPSYTAMLMAAALVLVAAFYVLRYWFIRQQQFGYISQATVAQNGVRSICQVATGAFGLRLGGLVCGELLGRSVGMTRMFREAWPQIKAYVFPIDPRGFREVIWEHWRFPIYSLPSSLADSLAANICIPLVVRYYGPEAGGYLALVQRVLAVPLVLISASVADAFHGRLALYARHTPDRVVKLFRKTSAALVCLGMIPAALLMLYAEPIFRTLFGSKWAMAGRLAAVVAPLFLAQFVVSPLSRLVWVLEGQRSKLIYDILALTSMVGVFAFSAQHQLSLVRAVMMLSLTGTLTFVVYYFVLMRIVARYRRALGSDVLEAAP